MTSVKTKGVGFFFHDIAYHTDIRSDMSTEELYFRLRSQLEGVLEDKIDVAFMDSSHDPARIMHLSYGNLKARKMYHAFIKSGPMSASAQGKGSLKVSANIHRILKHWGLREASDILPLDIMPPQQPSEWAIRFSQDLGKLAKLTRDRHGETVHLLRAQVQARSAHQPSGVAVVKAEDIRAVTAAVLEDMGETEKFAGGLEEAAEEALDEGEDGANVGWEYEEEGRFNIAMR